MAALFGLAGAFSSPIGQRIESVTDPARPDEDWMIILEICDMINSSDEGSKDAIKAIRKRLHGGSKNYKCILHTLTVTEAGVKNCGTRFHKQIATKDFLADLTKLLGTQKNPSNQPQVVQERILSLIQTWNDAFRNAPELQNVNATYESLKAQGIEFPALNMDNLSPIFTPQENPNVTKQQQHQQPPPQQQQQQQPPPQQQVGARIRTFAPVPNQQQQQQQQQQQATGPIHPTPEQLAKLRSELDIVERNAKVFTEMLNVLVPGQEDADDYELLTELSKTCKEMQNRLVQLVDRIANEEVTGVLLHTNDTLNNIFIRYERFERSRNGALGITPQDKPVNQPPEVTTSTQAQASTSGAALISFDAEPSEEETQTSKVIDDEFDMFAQSRSSNMADSRHFGSTYEDNSEVLVEGSIANVISAKGPYATPVHNPPPLATPSPTPEKVPDEDIEDVEEWLKGTDLKQLEADELANRTAMMKMNTASHREDKGHTSPPPANATTSMSSTEFDKFLSDRAASGSGGIPPARQMDDLANVQTKKKEDLFPM